jgi:hypothetical protein
MPGHLHAIGLGVENNEIRLLTLMLRLKVKSGTAGSGALGHAGGSGADYHPHDLGDCIYGCYTSSGLLAQRLTMKIHLSMGRQRRGRLQSTACSSIWLLCKIGMNRPTIAYIRVSTQKQRGSVRPRPQA